MRRNRLFPGSRLLLSLAGLVGLVHTVEEGLAQAGAPAEEIDPTTHAEPADVNAKWVLIAGVSVLLAVWAIVLLLYPLFRYFKYERTGGRDPSKVLVYLPPPPPHPQNQIEPHEDLAHYRNEQEGALHSYNWVDRNKGVVSIPIERAIQILSANGIPPVKAGSKQYYHPSAGTKQTGFEGKVEPLPR
jgi:hypothetical protein